MADVVTMPKLGFDMAEGVLIRWAKAEGEAVDKGELLAEIETDKATVEVESMYAGTVLKHIVKENSIVPVNDPIAVVGESGEDVDLAALLGDAAAAEAETAAPTKEEKAPAAQAAAQPAAQTESTAGNGKYPDGVKATPLARRIAEDKGIDLKAVTGSGPGGRIVKQDVEDYVAASAPAPAAPAAAPAPQAAPPKEPLVSLPSLSAVQVGPPPADEVVELSRLRQAIGRRMTEAKQQLPHFYVTSEYDMAAVMDLRKQSNAMLAGSGEKLSVNDFILKAVALALREFPNLNASLDGDKVVRHGQVNVGVAVAVDNGLLTVVNRDTDRKSLRQISSEVRSAAQRARSGKVSPNEIEGSTFSVSNLGMFDVEHFLAIINPPEAAILAVGSVLKVPVVKDGEVVPGLRMKATISVDHRVSDGAEAAQFMQTLRKYLENPLSLML
ncbi:MAG: 2-oxo acid dehydrogenase subunit E2 [Anaerolineales bacterium]|nr:2-oxo acid dehydrogenase subunit E2 [Anaerolineales bacterium]